MAETGPSTDDVATDDAVPYGRCNNACRSEPAFDCAECSGHGGCADPVHEGPFEVCSELCETAADCPAPPIPAEVICVYGGCYIGCESGECLEGQTCVLLVAETDPPVCMYPG